MILLTLWDAPERRGARLAARATGMVLRMRSVARLAIATLLVACQGTVPATSTPAPSAAASPPAASSTAAPTASALARSPTPQPTPTLTGWGELEPLPTPRSEVAATVFANTIFVIGGIGGPQVVERYIPISRAWKREPDLPVGVDHAMAASVPAGSQFGVYVFGGNSQGNATNRAFYLAPGADRWEEIAPMPAARAAGAAVAIGRKIYIVGGAASGTILHNSVYAYDVETNVWAIGADIPTPRDHLAAVPLFDRVCAVGGRVLDMSKNVSALECFDPVANRWDKRANMPTPRGGVGAAAVGEKIVVVGGERPEGTFAEVEVWDSRSNTWSRGQILARPRHGLGVVAIGRVIYAIGGGPTPGGSQTGVVEYWNLP